MFPLKVGGVYVRRCGCVGLAIGSRMNDIMRLKRIARCLESGHVSGQFEAKVSDGTYPTIFSDADRDRNIVREIEP